MKARAELRVKGEAANISEDAANNSLICLNDNERAQFSHLHHGKILEGIQVKTVPLLNCQYRQNNGLISH